MLNKPKLTKKESSEILHLFLGAKNHNFQEIIFHIQEFETIPNGSQY